MGTMGCRIFGFDFSQAQNVPEFVDNILKETRKPGFDFLITPNASMLVYFFEERNRNLREFYRQARYVCADGMPVVWISQFKGCPVRRLTGSDLFPELWLRLKQNYIPCVFVLANQDLANRLEQEMPGNRFVVPSYFDSRNQNYISELAQEIKGYIDEIQAQYVFIGLGFPKQELLAMAVSKVSAVPPQQPVLFLLLGASFEFYFGLKARAPVWMQKSGLEWLHRFLQEPGRLWKRYTIDSIRFFKLGILEVFKKSG